MTRIRVVVTAEDIARSRKSPTYTCPIREALRRRFPEAGVGITLWYPKEGMTDDEAPRVSAAATAFINAYDSHKPVQPATFYLQGPDR